MYSLQPLDLPELFPSYQTSLLGPPEDGSRGQVQGQRLLCSCLVSVLFGPGRRCMDNPGEKGRGSGVLISTAGLEPHCPSLDFVLSRLLGLAVSHFCQRTGCQCVPFEWHAHCTGILVGSVKERK